MQRLEWQNTDFGRMQARGGKQQSVQSSAASTACVSCSFKNDTRQYQKATMQKSLINTAFTHIGYAHNLHIGSSALMYG